MENSKKVLRLDVEGDYRLAVIGDFHWGCKHCDKDAVRKAIEEVKDFDGVILMGDLIESATRYSVGAGVYEQQEPQSQMEEILDLLEPIKEKIIGIHNGNHELRVYKETGIDLSALMARTLGVPYLGYSALTEIKVGKKLWSMYSTHGSTGAVTLQGKMTKCKNLTRVALADLYLMAHTHALNVESDKVRSVRYGRLIAQERLFCLTGGFLDYEGSYAEMKNYPMVDKGYLKVLFAEDKIETEVCK